MTTENCAVVCFASHPYGPGAERLRSSLQKEGFQGLIQIFTEFDQVGCRPHHEVPYQFKTFSIAKIDRERYPLVLYCDASIFAYRDVTPCFEHIAKHGYLLEDCGVSVGQFTADHCLKFFGIDRDEAMEISMHSAGFTGLDFRTEVAKTFFGHWHGVAQHEHCFKGAWSNENQECSPDLRCRGHRHDQSVASILAHNYGMKPVPQTFMKYYSEAALLDPQICFIAQGMV